MSENRWTFDICVQAANMLSWSQSLDIGVNDRSLFFAVGLPSDKCVLPLAPVEVADEIETGDRFGSKPESRKEYDIFPSTNTNK